MNWTTGTWDSQALAALLRARLGENVGPCCPESSPRALQRMSCPGVQTTDLFLFPYDLLGEI